MVSNAGVAKSILHKTSTRKKVLSERGLINIFVLGSMYQLYPASFTCCWCDQHIELYGYAPSTAFPESTFVCIAFCVEY